MAPMGRLSMLFRAEEEEEEFRRQLALANERDERAAAREKLPKREKKIKKPESDFRLPLHYPSYTKTQYENMSEWEIDVLLKQYGLFVDGDLCYKKDFAISAFLWDVPESSTDPSTSGSSTCRDVLQLQESTTCCSGLMENSGIRQRLMVFF